MECSRHLDDHSALLGNTPRGTAGCDGSGGGSYEIHPDRARNSSANGGYSSPLARQPPEVGAAPMSVPSRGPGPQSARGRGGGEAANQAWLADWQGPGPQWNAPPPLAAGRASGVPSRLEQFRYMHPEHTAERLTEEEQRRRTDGDAPLGQGRRPKSYVARSLSRLGSISSRARRPAQL